jgi:hypothetical protein
VAQKWHTFLGFPNLKILAIVVYCVVGGAVLCRKFHSPLSELCPGTKVSPMGYTELVSVRESAIEDKKCPATQETVKFLGGNFSFGRKGGFVAGIDLCPVNVIDNGGIIREDCSPTVTHPL